MSSLKGFTLPRTPLGHSSLVSPPPWHFSGDLLFINFRVPPEVAARFLPEELATGDQLGRGAAVFADCQSTGEEGGELRDPVRSQFREFYLMLACELGGAPAVRIAFMWVDKSFSLARGWLQGLPKKHGSIWVTRPITVGRAGGRLEPGGSFSASLAANDRRLAEAHLTLTGRADAAPDLHSAPVVNTRLFPAWGSSTTGVEETIVSGSGAEVGEVWRGDAELSFFPAAADELADLGPVEVEDGFFFPYADTLVAGRPPSA
jgi:enduracididine biosynthesis enzyme MppR